MVKISGRKQTKPSLETRDSEGKTPLHLACLYDKFTIVELLLRMGASANARALGSLATPLHFAFRNGNQKMAKVLLKYGGNLLLQDSEGNTPVHYALRYCNNSQSECESSCSNYSRQSTSKNDDWKCIESRADYIAALEVRNRKGLRPKEMLDIGLQQVVEKLAFAFFEKKHAKVLNSHRDKENNNGNVPSEAVPKKKLRIKKLSINKASSKYRLHFVHQQTTQDPVNMHSATTEMGSESISEEISSARCGSVASEETKDYGRHGLESYEALRLLGKGSFGEVYLVRHKETKELFAMKVIQKMKIMSQNLIRYAMTEKKVMAQTNNPFVVKLKTAFQTKERLFLIMEYCPGGDLSQCLIKEKRFTEDRARIYLCEIILAIEDLHKRNIIFRYQFFCRIEIGILSQTMLCSIVMDMLC